MYQKFYRKKKKIKAAQFFIPLEKGGGKSQITNIYTCIVEKKLNKQTKKYFTKFTHFFLK